MAGVVKRVAQALTAAILLSVLVLVVARAHDSASLDGRVHSVAQALRCPTCNGESLAASETPLAQSMRGEIRRQLARGRSPAQVRAWFENRYGPQVLMVPGPSVTWAALVAGSLATLVLGGVAWSSARRNRGRSPARAPAQAGGGGPISARRLIVVALAVGLAGATVPVAVAAHAGRSAPQPAAGATTPATTTPATTTPASDPVAKIPVPRLLTAARALEDDHRYAAAAEAYQSVLRRRPGSGAVRTRLGFDLLRAGRAAAATRVLTPVTSGSRPRPLAVLVLGLAQRRLGRASARGTLSRFLDLAPHHPAAAQVRHLLREQP